jgi:hypothetical protein
MGFNIKKYVLLALISSMFFSGCATNYKNFEPEELTFERHEPYNPSWLYEDNSIEKPDWLYAKMNGDDLEFTSGNDPEATYLVLTSEEYKKIKMLLNKHIGTKQMLYDHVELVNVKIDIINSIQYRAELERKLTKEYFQLWKNTDEAYNKERRAHVIDNIINRGTLVLGVIGGIALIAL